MKKTFFTLAISIITQLSVAQTHSANIANAFSDLRGQVAMTIDAQKEAKIWNLADGKLLATVDKTSVEWPVKLLRYKINHDDYTKRGETVTMLKSGSRCFSFNDNVVAYTEAKGSYAWHHDSRLIFETDFKNNQLILYRMERKPDTANFVNVQLGNSWLVLPDVYYPDFSPKNKWLIARTPNDRELDFLINPQTGAVVRFDPSIKIMTNNLAKPCFNEDETQLAITTENGIAVLDAVTGKSIKEIKLPKKIREKANYIIYPMSDMKSFIYTGVQIYSNQKEGTNKAWLVNESGAILLGN